LSAYRADIDGLRAVAVFCVVLFHAGVSGIDGGFIGVDVFFVISGFLLTRIMCAELADGSFSLLRFYERRIRRIFPALFVLLGVVTLVAHRVFMPWYYASYAETLWGATLFVSNYVLIGQAGYFAVESGLTPLLHTWSLAVEEQFYILLPLTMWLSARVTRKRYAFVLVPLLVASFAWGVHVSADPQSGFFAAPGRAWELLVGSILGIGAIPPIRRRGVAQALGVVGLGVILFAAVWFDDATRFPGYAALAPTLGTACIIHAGAGYPGNLAARLLSLPVPVFVGRISYSFYLWHWPALVFGRYMRLGQLTGLETVVLLLGAFGLAVVSYRYVEQPFRDKTRIRSQRLAFGLAAVLMAGFASAGFYVQGNKGMPDRFDPSLRVLFDIRALRGDGTVRNCAEPHHRREELRHQYCALGATGEARRFVLWGDSHAGALRGVASRAALTAGQAGYSLIAPGCPPVLGVQWHLRPGLRCAESNARALAYIKKNGTRTVILHGRWAFQLSGEPYGSELERPIYLSPGTNAQNAQKLEAGLARTLEDLSTFADVIYIVTGVPEVGKNVPHAVWLRTRGMPGLDVSPTRAEYDARQRDTLALLDRMAARFAKVRLVHPSDVLCDARHCRTVENGEPLYADDDHLSVRGQRLLRPLFERMLAAEPSADP
jgi:peptidoglycan/LPS O-acetylase OafA/YrhL